MFDPLRCLIWRRVVQSRDIHPCEMVPSCQVSRFQRPHVVIVNGGSMILTTESRTHCSIAPAYMNVHIPYLIPSVSMDPGAWCRCLVSKHNRYHLLWGTVHRRLETVHTNPNPNRLACVSVVLVRSPILNECRKDNNLVNTHHSASETIYTTDHAPIEF